MLYRPGGGARPINPQYDTVFTDAVGGATGWLAVSKGNTIAVNVCRASLVFGSVAKSTILPTVFAPEVQVVMEMRLFNGDSEAEARPIDQWQNMIVATSRRAHRDGYVRLRTISLTNPGGDGIALDLQISRTGDAGAST